MARVFVARAVVLWFLVVLCFMMLLSSD
jgi:hypothetical protein